MRWLRTPELTSATAALLAACVGLGTAIGSSGVWIYDEFFKEENTTIANKNSEIAALSRENRELKFRNSEVLQINQELNRKLEDKDLVVQTTVDSNEMLRSQLVEMGAVDVNEKLALVTELTNNGEVARALSILQDTLENSSMRADEHAAIKAQIADLELGAGNARAAALWYERAAHAGSELAASLLIRSADLYSESGYYERAEAIYLSLLGADARRSRKNEYAERAKLGLLLVKVKRGEAISDNLLILPQSDVAKSDGIDLSRLCAIQLALFANAKSKGEIDQINGLTEAVLQCAQGLSTAFVRTKYDGYQSVVHHYLEVGDFESAYDTVDEFNRFAESSNSENSIVLAYAKVLSGQLLNYVADASAREFFVEALRIVEQRRGGKLEHVLFLEKYAEFLATSDSSTSTLFLERANQIAGRHLHPRHHLRHRILTKLATAYSTGRECYRLQQLVSDDSFESIAQSHLFGPIGADGRRLKEWKGRFDNGEYC